MCHKYKLLFLVMQMSSLFINIINSYPEKILEPNLQHMKQLMSSIDLMKYPCVNFYEFACGEWSSYQKNEHYSNIEELVDYRTNLELIKIVPNMNDEILKMDVFNHTFNYYQSCLKAEGSAPMLEYLKIIKPAKNLEWPLLWHLREGSDGKKWPADQFDVYAFLGQLFDYGFGNILIRAHIEQTASDAVITLSRPTENTLDLYIIVNMIEKLRRKKRPSLTEFVDAIELQSLQVDLNNMSKSYEEKRGHRTVLFESNDDFERLKEGNFASFYRYIKNIGILHTKKNVKIYVADVPYFYNLFGLHWTKEMKEKLCNYIMLNLLQYLIKDKGTTGYSKLECIKEVRQKLDLPLTFLYYLHVYKSNEIKTNPDIRNIFRQLVDSLTQLVTQFENKSGLPFNTEFKPQLRNTTMNVGNQPRNVRNSHIKGLFVHIPQLQPNDFYMNHLQLLRHKMITSFKRFDYRTHVMYSPNNGIGYSSTPFHDEVRNMLILPLGLLKPPIYHPDLHPIFKWSTLGFILARNIIHTYDAGIPYYFPSTSMEPKLYRQCIQQFQNNSKTIGVTRNIGAAAVAYHAYLQNHPNQLQPDFTDIPWQKLFFLNLAQTFCTSEPHLRKRNNFYLQTITERFPGFREAFSCPRSDIKPKDMCTFSDDYEFL
ncbi:membrane metallo-endopeptidase-like 1 [Musca autumnalis]|uniref:membrane metallo-endopeptidase-like 1 n=1 Tax=Musca autumnalis TaxID=221902 RepID=UPI003CF03925